MCIWWRIGIAFFQAIDGALSQHHQPWSAPQQQMTMMLKANSHDHRVLYDKPCFELKLFSVT